MTGLTGTADAKGLAAVQRSARSEMVWRWVRWTRWPISVPIFWLAVATVVVDVLTAWIDFDFGALGRVPTSPALPLGIALALAIGLRRLGFDKANRLAWREFLIAGGVALFLSVIAYGLYIGGLAEGIGLVVGALGEELVYRLAVLVVVGAIAAKLLGRNWRNAEDWGMAPGIAAIVAAGVVFSLLPGHVQQMSDTLHAVPFVSLGVVFGYVVLRTGALLPAAIVHALLNLATIAAVYENTAIMFRTALAATALLALIAGTIVAGRRLGILRQVADTVPV